MCGCRAGVQADVSVRCGNHLHTLHYSRQRTLHPFLPGQAARHHASVVTSQVDVKTRSLAEFQAKLIISIILIYSHSPPTAFLPFVVTAKDFL